MKGEEVKANRKPDLFSTRHASRIADLVKSSGGKVVCGGDFDIDSAYIPPTLVENADFESSLMRDEIFGPVLPVFKMTNIDEVINFVNDRY